MLQRLFKAFGNRAIDNTGSRTIRRQEAPRPGGGGERAAQQPAQPQAGSAAAAAAPALSSTARFIEQWEGRRRHVYNDTQGHPTVGVGFNLDRPDAAQQISAVGANYSQVRNGTATLNDSQIDTLLQNGADRAIASARTIVNNFDSLPQPAQQIVVDMVYNLGATRFAQFRNTINALEQSDFDRAADEMRNSRWYGQTGIRAQNHVSTMRSLAVPPTPPQTTGQPQ